MIELSSACGIKGCDFFLDVAIHRFFGRNFFHSRRGRRRRKDRFAVDFQVAAAAKHPVYIDRSLVKRFEPQSTFSTLANPVMNDLPIGVAMKESPLDVTFLRNPFLWAVADKKLRKSFGRHLALLVCRIIPELAGLGQLTSDFCNCANVGPVSFEDIVLFLVKTLNQQTKFAVDSFNVQFHSVEGSIFSGRHRRSPLLSGHSFLNCLYYSTFCSACQVFYKI